MLNEQFTINVDGLTVTVTISGKDDIAVLKRRNEIYRFILGVPETIVITQEMLDYLELNDLESSWNLPTP